MRHVVPTCLALALLVSACARSLPPPADDGVPRIDGRSDESFDSSVDRVRQPLTPREREAFLDAVLRIHSQTSTATLRAAGPDFKALHRAMREQLHGKSAAEILAEADRIPAK